MSGSFNRSWIGLIALMAALSACSHKMTTSPAGPLPSNPDTATPTYTPILTPTIDPSFTPSHTATHTPTLTNTVAASPTTDPSLTPTPTATSTDSSQTDTPTVNHPSYTYTPLNTATFTPTSTRFLTATLTTCPTNTQTPPPASTATPPYCGSPVTMGNSIAVSAVSLGTYQGVAVQFIAPTSGFLRSIWGTIGNSTVGTLGVYSDVAGSPGVLLTSGGTLGGYAWPYRGYGVPPIAVTAGQAYWIVYTDILGSIYYNGSGGNALRFGISSMNPMPANFSTFTSPVADSNLYTLFAQVCDGATITPTPTSLYTITPTSTPTWTPSQTPTPTGTWYPPPTPTPTPT